MVVARMRSLQNGNLHVMILRSAPGVQYLEIMKKTIIIKTHFKCHASYENTSLNIVRLFVSNGFFVSSCRRADR